jgi:hypothetical protein
VPDVEAMLLLVGVLAFLALVHPAVDVTGVFVKLLQRQVFTADVTGFMCHSSHPSSKYQMSSDVLISQNRPSPSKTIIPQIIPCPPAL